LVSTFSWLAVFSWPALNVAFTSSLPAFISCYRATIPSWSAFISALTLMALISGITICWYTCRSYMIAIRFSISAMVSYHIGSNTMYPIPLLTSAVTC
jgi:hypothetical protein